MKRVISFLGYYPFPEPTTWQGKVKKYRHIHGLTLEEFGQLIGFDGATVWTWENEKYIPNKITLNKVLNIMR